MIPVFVTSVVGTRSPQEAVAMKDIEKFGASIARSWADGMVAGAQKHEPELAAYRETDTYKRLTEYERSVIDRIWRTLWNIAWSRR